MKTKTINSAEKNGKKQTMRRILVYIRPHAPLAAASLLLAFISVILQLLIPVLVGRGVDLIVSKGNVDTAALLRLILGTAVCILATALAQWFMNHINNVITFRVVRDLRIRVFGHIHTLPLSYLDSHSSGDTMSRVITDVEQFSDGLLLGFSQLFSGILTIAGTIAFMLYLQPVITVIVVIFTPLSFRVASEISNRSYHYFRKQSEARGSVTDLTNEMVGNLKLVQTFGRETAVTAAFAERNEILGEYNRKATFISSLTNPSTRFVNTLIYNGVVFAGCLLCFLSPFGRSVMSIGELTGFLSYVRQYSQPFNDITSVITEFQNSLASAARVFEILEEESEPSDAENAVSPASSDGAVEIRNVSFSYVPEKPLIGNLNLSVQPGKRIAIVGPTGCGKTTLINLLMRFYDVNEGSIELDGTDIRQIRRECLRANFGMVLQDTWLKAGTIADNIAYGCPDATRKEVEQAAKKAHADGFIRRMPNGYDTVIGESGGSLSAGQKQLLCIARVMLHLPPVLILDEATSSIDTRTEICVQKAFDAMMKGRTSFVVAHRLSTIRDADEILVMKDGHIIEQGSHEALLAADGFYSRLYHTQFEKSTD